MDLSFWLTTLSLLAMVYAGGKWIYGVYIEPARAAAQGGQSVKRKPRSLAFKQRSKRSNVQNAVNAGSTHQEAVQPVVNVQSVQAPTAAIATPVGAPPGSGDNFTLTPGELIQLAETLRLRAEGATVEEAILGGFGAKKGATDAYKRAKALFDAASVAPGAAPAGTYPAQPTVRAVRRPGRRVRSAQ